MFDRYEAGERAVLVHVNFTQRGEWEDLSECKMLISSAGVTTLHVVTGSRQTLTLNISLVRQSPRNRRSRANAWC